MPPDEPAVVPTPAVVQPEIRIGLQQNAAHPTLTGDRGLRVIDPDEGELRLLAAEEPLTVTAAASQVSVTLAGRRTTRRLLVVRSADPAGMVYLDGRPYHGAIELAGDSDGVRVVNLVGLEDYLVGVVTAELGARPEQEVAAAMAQAVVARTYALRNSGRWADQGFDLLAGVASQVYRGAADEDPVARRAVEATAGEVLMYGDQLIDAFYSSTCGGESEAGGAVFADGERPYLQARPDVDAEGRAWCAISPRYRWTERWSGSALQGILRQTLAAEHLSTARATDLREARVLARTPSGRVAQLELVGDHGRTVVSGAAIRRVWAPTRGGILESGDFTIRIGRQGGRLEEVVMEGKGYGHGVGLCQWGAIGRARAGQSYLEILMSYFPGTDLRRIY
jgi:stage II sporulation protein D